MSGIGTHPSIPLMVLRPPEIHFHCCKTPIWYLSASSMIGSSPSIFKIQRLRASIFTPSSTSLLFFTPVLQYFLDISSFFKGSFSFVVPLRLPFELEFYDFYHWLWTLLNISHGFKDPLWTSGLFFSSVVCLDSTCNLCYRTYEFT